MQTEPLAEPWLRGPTPGVDTLLAPLLYSLQMAREDLAQWTESLTSAQIWAAPHGFGSVGFHLRHIAGSTDRLMTYLQGRALGEEQMTTLRAEDQPDGPGRDELLAGLSRVFAKAESVVCSLDPATLADVR